MKICMMSVPYRDFLDEVKFAGENGFDGVELAFEYPSSTPEQVLARKDELLDLLSTYKLTRLAHTQTFVDIANFYDELREASISETAKALDAAYKLEIGFLTVHPGFRFPLLSRERAFQNAANSLRKLAGKAEDYGLTIGVENLPAGVPPLSEHFTRVDEFKKLFSQLQLENLSFVLDIAHANLPRSDPPQTFIEELYGSLSHVHVSDNLGERDDHLPLGAGRTDYATPLKQLAEKGYKGTITLEVFSPDREYRVISKRKLESVLNSKWKGYG